MITIDVRNYGNIGYGVDATPALINALAVSANTNWTQPLELSGSLPFETTGFTIPPQASIVGNGAFLVPHGNTTGTLLTQTYNTTGYGGAGLYIRPKLIGFIIDGQNQASGGYICGSGPNLIMEDMVIQGCTGVGANLNTSQFSHLRGLRVISNGVGLYMTNDPSSGGGNSCQFDQFLADANKIGVLIQTSSYGPQYGQLFNNPVILSNSTCGIAIDGSASLTYGTGSVRLVGGHTESNGLSGNTFTYNGVTYPPCAMFLNHAKASWSGPNFGSPGPSPYIIMQNNSNLMGDFWEGYGNNSGILVQCDSTSKVSVSRNLAAGTIQYYLITN